MLACRAPRPKASGATERDGQIDGSARDATKTGVSQNAQVTRRLACPRGNVLGWSRSRPRNDRLGAAQVQVALVSCRLWLLPP